MQNPQSPPPFQSLMMRRISAIESTGTANACAAHIAIGQLIWEMASLAFGENTPEAREWIRQCHEKCQARVEFLQFADPAGPIPASVEIKAKTESFLANIFTQGFPEPPG